MAAVPHWFLCESVASDRQHPYCFLLDDELQLCDCQTPGAAATSFTLCVLTWSHLANSPFCVVPTVFCKGNISAGSWYVCLSSPLTHELHFCVDISGSRFLAHSLFCNKSVIKALSSSPTTSPLSSWRAHNWRTSKHGWSCLTFL